MWEDGILAWDHVHSDFVLVILFISALLGDNPMQSEFACHVGAMGNLFCRICSVSTGPHPCPPTERAPETVDMDDVPPNGSPLSGAASDASTDGGQQRKKKHAESMAEMVNRIERFVKVSTTPVFTFWSQSSQSIRSGKLVVRRRP